MTKYTSGRQKNIKVGITSYSENRTSLEVVGKVGIGTTNATSSLYVVGDQFVTGVITASSFIGGIGSLTQLSVSGVTTVGVLTATRIGIGTTNPTAELFVVGNSNISGIVTIGAGNTGISINGTTGIITSISGITTVTFVGNLVGTASTASFATTSFTLNGRTESQFNVAFATTAGIATFATNSGIATFATNSGIATFATNSGIATFSTNAGIATFATNSGIATFATTAGISTNVIGGIGSLTQLSVSGFSTVGVLTATRIGIGTTNPTVELFVVGNSIISGIVTVGTGNSGISINGTTGIISSSNPGITTVTFVGNLIGIAQVDVTNVTNTTNVIGGIASVTRLSVSGISTVGVLTATNIGIGTTNPTEALFVVGNSVFTGNVNVSGIITASTASFIDIILGGSVSIGATTGTSGQYLISTGIGVSWSSLSTLRNSFTTTATSNQTTFNVNYNVGFLDVFINGVRLTDSEFTATNGTSFILGESCFGGETVDILAYNTSATGTAPNMVSAPATSSSSGISGQTAFDSSYFYVCISPNTWKRIVLSSW